MKGENFSLSRRIVSNVTLESWHTIPHACITYNADVTKLICVLNNYNSDKDKTKKITLNTALLKIISEGIKQCPCVNTHIQYNPFFISGRTLIKKNIDVSMPLVVNGKMITVNVRNLESKNMEQIRDYILDLRQKAENTIIDEALLEVAVKDTLKGLKHGKILTAIKRLIGTKFGPYKVKRISYKERRAYKKTDPSKRLTSKDLEQGTLTVTNLGSIYKEWNGICTMLEIIPPQIVAIALSSIQKSDNSSFITFTIAFDHRALDFGDIVPFMKSLDSIFNSKSDIEELI